MILRLRSAMNTINLHYCDRRVLIVCHQVVVLCMRYILEELTEEQILADRQAGRDPELRHLRLRLRAGCRRPLRSQARSLEPRRAAGGRRRSADRRARHDDRDAMKAASRSPAPALKKFPLPPVVDGDKETKGRILIIAGMPRACGRGAARRPVGDAGRRRQAAHDHGGRCRHRHVARHARSHGPRPGGGTRRRLHAKAIRRIGEEADRSDVVVAGPGMANSAGVQRSLLRCCFRARLRSCSTRRSCTAWSHSSPNKRRGPRACPPAPCRRARLASRLR